MVEQTPQATAVDATIAEASATQAAVAANAANTAAQSAIANAQVVAAEAEAQAAERTAKIAAETDERLNKWREEISQQVTSSQSAAMQEIQTLRAETGTLAQALSQTQEALKALLTPPKPSAEIAVVTPEATSQKDADGQKDQKTTPTKRRLVRI